MKVYLQTNFLQTHVLKYPSFKMCPTPKAINFLSKCYFITEIRDSYLKL